MRPSVHARATIKPSSVSVCGQEGSHERAAHITANHVAETSLLPAALLPTQIPPLDLPAAIRVSLGRRPVVGADLFEGKAKLEVVRARQIVLVAGEFLAAGICLKDDEADLTHSPDSHQL